MKMITMINPCVFHMKFIVIQGMSFTNSKGIAKLQNLEPLKISVLWSTVKYKHWWNGSRKLLQMLPKK